VAIVVDSIAVQTERMKDAAADPDLIATDLVEYLVLKGVPFRAAHESVAQAVKLARQSGCLLSELSLEQFHKINPGFEVDLFQLFDPVKSALSKTSAGGTGKADQLVDSLIQHSEQQC